MISKNYSKNYPDNFNQWRSCRPLHLYVGFQHNNADTFIPQRIKNIINNIVNYPTGLPVDLQQRLYDLRNLA